jgi:hypothetical protein
VPGHGFRSNASVNQEASVVRYIEPLSSRENLVLQVRAHCAGASPTTSIQFDLADALPQGNRHCTITRNFFNDPRASFPPLFGHLNVYSSLSVGRTVGGNFSIAAAAAKRLASNPPR